MYNFTLAEFAKNSENKEEASFTPEVQEDGIKQGTLIVSRLYNTMLGAITKTLKSWDAEITNVLDEAGIAPSGLSNEQLLAAIIKLIDRASGHLIGEYVQSMVPLNYSGAHLLDGSVINGEGVYKNFVEYMATLYSEQPSLFITESAYQQSINLYGVCGKFVYNTTANTIRLPKLSSPYRYLIDSYINEHAWYRVYSDGWCEQGNINRINSEGQTVNLLIPFVDTNYTVVSGGHSPNQPTARLGNTSANVYTTSSFSGWTSDDESFNAGELCWTATGYVDISGYKVSPLYTYIILTSAAKTDIEVDIDNIMTDLNGKVDKSDMSEVQCVVESYSNGTEWYRIWSDGWCEQGGRANSGTISVTFIKEFADTNYTITVTPYSTTASDDNCMVTGLTTSGFTALVEASIGTFWKTE